MANRQGFNNSGQFLELVHQLSLLTEQSRIVHFPPQHSNNDPLQNFNSSQNNTQMRQRIREAQTSVKTRRKPRHKKNKQEQDSTSRQSLSSNSSISVSPLKNRLVVPGTSRNSRSEYLESSTSPSTSKAQNSSQSGSSCLKDSVTFSIASISSNKDSKFLRKRSYKKKFINVRSFISGRTSSCLFISKAIVSTTSKKLNDSEKKDKANLRKYPKKESRRERKKKEQEKEEETFSDYINEQDVKEGLSNGTLIKGVIRINPKNARESYVNNEDSTITDYCVTSITDRNRALEGDEVVLQLKPDKEWTAENKTAKVVYLTQKVHTRRSIGTLKPFDQEQDKFALFIPRDKRFPVLKILQLHWPIGFKEKPKQFENVLFVAQLLEWNAPNCAQGLLVEKLGQSGNLKIESMSILKENNLDISPFTEEMKDCLPQLKVIPKEEFEYREDLRKKCIFTIDPATARDLDDAVSVEILPNGNLEVGVHISDAAFYLEEGTELDQVVSKKATTIYLVDNVYHMLPEELCMFCSLLPGEDKLSFSVFWEMTQNGDILSKRFSRSVMNSCTKLSYEHAQMIIENPDKEFDAQDFPPIYNGFAPRDLVDTINILQRIAIILRDNRIRNGALKIDNTKLYFSLHPATGEPLNYSIQENKESHRLIEEFMLLANISVAQKIYEHFPEMAFLRCHDPPKENMLATLRSKLALYGIHLNTSSSGAIAASLKKYITDDYAGYTRAAALNHLISKAMTRAQYFCSSNKETESNFKHYALSVPIYTHFTSPIRRYADIMVHRLLAASLNYRDPPEWDVAYVEAIAKNCNAQKYQAKKAGDASMELYLAHYVEQHKSFQQDCVVVDVREKKFDVVVLKTGTTVRIYPNSCGRGTNWVYEPPNKVTITFPKNKQVDKVSITVELFSLVRVNLRRKDSYHLEGSLVRPMPAKVFNRQKKR